VEVEETIVGMGGGDIGGVPDFNSYCDFAGLCRLCFQTRGSGDLIPL
jgi:hypothetical protein